MFVKHGNGRVEGKMAKRYTLRKRAESQDRTRRKIIEAAVELHGTLGPAQSSISAIAERAGVQRLTVYRHFPDVPALLAACSGHYQQENPIPDADAWRRIARPVERLRTALAELYRYYRRNEAMLSNVFRDAELLPELAALQAPYAAAFAGIRDLLAQGWSVPAAHHHLLLAAVAHALDFATWRSLTAGEGLSDDEAAELMVRLVASLDLAT
jgi:AcrR family transcriptional regulator